MYINQLLYSVILGPAVLGWVKPSEIIEILAQLGIFFLMLHAGVDTKPREFFEALRDSLGIALVGALVPFSVSIAVGLYFGLPILAALFVGLTMTATAVVITIKILRDLGLQNTRMARIVIASCVLDDILTLVLFSVVLGIVREGSFAPLSLLWISLKSILFFGVVIAIGYYLYPLLKSSFS